MNLDEVTIQDCIDMYHMKGQIAIIENGKVIGFQGERKNPHTDR